MATINLGMVTAYAYAVEGGYTGTEAEFETLLANVATTLNKFENFSATANTLAEGASATASYSGGILTLGIPKGDTGATGTSISSVTLNADYTLTINFDDGTSTTTGSIRGATGATPNLTIGTVTTGEVGADAAATITGTTDDPVLNLTLPRGATGDTTNIADVFDSTVDYTEGEYVIYNDLLYVFTADHSAGSWDGSDAEQVTVGEEMSSLKDDIVELAEDGTQNIALTVTNGYVSASNGTIVSNTGYRYSQLIEVTEGDKYYFQSRGSSSTLTLAMYTSDDTTTADLDNSIAGTGDVVTSGGTIPTGISYVRISYINTYADAYFKIVSKAITYAEELVDALDTELSADIAEIVTEGDTRICTINSTFYNGNLSSGGTFTDNANSRTTDFLPIIPGVKYLWDIQRASGSINPRYICLYDSTKTWVRNISASSALSSGAFTAYGDEWYVRINVGYSSAIQFDVYPDATSYTYTSLNSDIVVPQVDSISVDDDAYHARRPIIAFMLDGLYDYNQTMLDIIAEHGYSAGVAPAYVKFIDHDDIIYTIKQWAEEGHEIMAHGHVSVLESTYTEEEAAALIKNAYAYPLSVGIDVKGYIAANGSFSSTFLPYVQKYFDWGATVANKSASNTPYHLFSTSNPYKLWRYSMQLSTLDEQKAAVDSAISNNGLLLFYGHANSEQLGYFTEANFEELLDYVDAKVANLDCKVYAPTEAIRRYYAIRYEDVVSS